MRVCPILAFLLATTSFGAEFEAASIKPAPQQQIGRTSVRTSSNTSTGDLTYLNVNIRDLIGQGFKLAQYQITTPDSMNDVRFDIAARFKPGSTPEELREMLQGLLAERFGLKFHREIKELPVFALIMAKGGPKMKAAEATGGSSSRGENGRIRLEAKVTMERFAEYLAGRVDRPVVHQTGLFGPFEITLEFALEDRAGADTTVPLLVTAMPEQLGLRLDSTKAPIESLVVDNVSRTPTEN